LIEEGTRGKGTKRRRHMGKENLQNEGELPMAPSVDAQLYRRTLEIIAGHESNLDSSLAEEGTGGKGTKRRRH
jgi:hypothetical protein